MSGPRLVPAGADVVILGEEDVERTAPGDLPVPEHFAQATAQAGQGAPPRALQEHRGGQVGLPAGECAVRCGGRRYRLGYGGRRHDQVLT